MNKYNAIPVELKQYKKSLENMGDYDNIINAAREEAEKQGWASGLVVTCYLQHATPAAFYAHVKSRGENDEITKWFYKSDIDVAFGGGMKYFKRVSENEGKDFNKEIANMGYTLHTDMKNIKSAPSEGKVLGIYADGYWIVGVGLLPEGQFFEKTKQRPPKW